MTRDRSSRLALASLAALLADTLALAPASALAQDAARVPGNKYVVVNQTRAPLACRYRVNSGAGGGGAGRWQEASPVPAGGEFTRTAQAPGESVSLDCNAGEGQSATVQPGRRYNAVADEAGKVAITR